MMEYLTISKIYRFLVMREAHEVGLVSDETWKECVKEMMVPMIEAYEETKDEAD